MREQPRQPEDLDGYTKNGFYGRVQSQILKLEAEGRKARAESFIVIPKQGIWRRMGRRTFYRLFGLHYISEEDDPVTKGIQAAINRAHSKIFIKDGNYYLNQGVQYPTNPPNFPSALTYDFAKSIVLEGESPDATLQLDGIELFSPNDYYVNKHPYLRFQTLTLEGVNHPAAITFGGASYGYIFLWDVTLTNVQGQSIFQTDFISIRNMRIFNTLINTGPVGTPGGININTDAQGEIDGYYVYGYDDNALAFNNTPGWFNASHIHIFKGSLTQQIGYAININGVGVPLNINLDDVVTNGAIGINNTTSQNTQYNVNFGKVQLLSGGYIIFGGTGGTTLSDIYFDTIFVTAGNSPFNVFNNLQRITVNHLDFTWNNPNATAFLITVGNASYTGKIRFGTVKINIVSQPSTANGYIIPNSVAFTVDIDELSVAVAPGQGGFLLTGANAPSPGSLIKRALINGVLQTFPPNILVNPPGSGATYQNTNGYGIVLLIPVALTPTSSAAASASIAVGTSPSTLSTVQTLTQAAGAGPAGGVLQAAVPSGQYYQITLTNATASQAIVLPE